MFESTQFKQLVHSVNSHSHITLLQEIPCFTLRLRAATNQVHETQLVIYWGIFRTIVHTVWTAIISHYRAATWQNLTTTFFTLRVFSKMSIKENTLWNWNETIELLQQFHNILKFRIRYLHGKILKNRFLLLLTIALAALNECSPDCANSFNLWKKKKGGNMISLNYCSNETC